MVNIFDVPRRLPISTIELYKSAQNNKNFKVPHCELRKKLI